MTGSPQAKVQRRLAAIFAADVVGYSSLMGQDEEGTLRRVKQLRHDILQPSVEAHRGRIFKAVGDGFLAEFSSPVEAVRCALEVQDILAGEASHNPSHRLQVRIGINLGDIIVEEDGDVYGDGVNIAARLEQLADPGSICVSGPVYDQVEGKIGRPFESLGDQTVKNIAKSIRVYALGGTRVPRSTPATTQLALPDRPSIAVLPFTNMSGDPEQEYFADGVVEDIVTALSRVRWFFVIARNSSFTYKYKAVDVRQVGRELGVRYILQGSVRKAGGRVRITGQLIEAETGHHIWADRFDGNLEDVFELQDRITESVVGAIEPSLRVVEMSRAGSKPTESLDAYDFYLRGLKAFYEGTRQGCEAAVSFLKSALRTDPGFTTAKGCLALVHTTRFSQGWIEPSDKDEAIGLGREVLAEGSDDPFALVGAGYAVGTLAKEYEQGLRALEAALALNPNSSLALMFAGWMCCHLCEGGKAERYFETAMRLSPVAPETGYTLAGMGFALTIKGEYVRALHVLEDARRRLPSFTGAYRMTIWSLVELGLVEDAKLMAVRHMELDPAFTISNGPAAVLRDPLLRQSYFSALRKAGLPK